MNDIEMKTLAPSAQYLQAAASPSPERPPEVPPPSPPEVPQPDAPPTPNNNPPPNA